MNQEIKIFEHEDFGQVRVLDRDNNPWFIAKDVAEVLGYVETEKLTRRLDDDEKLTSQFGRSGQLREV